MCACVYVHVRACICVNIRVCGHVYVRMCACIYASIHVCMCYVCMYACVSMHVRMNVFKHRHFFKTLRTGARFFADVSSESAIF